MGKVTKNNTSIIMKKMCSILHCIINVCPYQCKTYKWQ